VKHIHKFDKIVKWEYPDHFTDLPCASYSVTAACECGKEAHRYTTSEEVAEEIKKRTCIECGGFTKMPHITLRDCFDFFRKEITEEIERLKEHLDSLRNI